MGLLVKSRVIKQLIDNYCFAKNKKVRGNWDLTFGFELFLFLGLRPAFFCFVFNFF